MHIQVVQSRCMVPFTCISEVVQSRCIILFTYIWGVYIQVVQSLLQYNCDVERQWQGPGGQSCSLVGVALRHGHVDMLPLLADVGAVCTSEDLAEMSADLSSTVASDPSMSDWLRQFTVEPRLLQSLCRRRVRRQLSCDIRHEVDRLPLPTKLRQYIVKV